MNAEECAASELPDHLGFPRNWRKKQQRLYRAGAEKQADIPQMRPELGFNTTQRWSQRSTNRNKSRRLIQQQTANSQIGPRNHPIRGINNQILEPRLRSRATQSIRDRQRLYRMNWPRNHPEPALLFRTLPVPSLRTNPA